MSNIVQLKIDTPNKEIIAIAKDILRDAESGQLRSLAAIGERNGGNGTSSWVCEGDVNVNLLCGHLMRLVHRLQLELDQVGTITQLPEDPA